MTQPINNNESGASVRTKLNETIAKANTAIQPTDLATTAQAGLMSAADKTALDGVPQAIADAVAQIAGADLGDWTLQTDIPTLGVSFAIADQNGNAAFVITDEGEILGVTAEAPQEITHTVLRWYHEPYKDPSEAFYLTWHSNSENARLAQVKLESGGDWITVQSYRTRAFPFRDEEYIHTAIVQGVSAGSIYDVRWPGAEKTDKLWTCPRGTSLKCLVASDHQRPNSITSEDREMIVFGQIISQRNIDIMLMPGDFVNDDGVQSTLNSTRWCNFIEVLSEGYRTHGGAQMPWLLLVGNHEMFNAQGRDHDGTGTDAYMDILWSHGYDPNDPTRFARSAMTTKFGRHFYLVNLETDQTVPLPGAQTDWFADVIDECPKYRHAMVMGHAPAFYFSSPLAGRDAVDTQSRHIRNHLWPMMVAQGNVRCYISGHTHILSETHKLITHFDPELSLSLNDLRWTLDSSTGVRQLGCGPWQADPRSLPASFPESSIDGSVYMASAIGVTNYSHGDRTGTVQQAGSGLSNVPENNNFHVWELEFTEDQFIARALNRDGETMRLIEEAI